MKHTAAGGLLTLADPEYKRLHCRLVSNIDPARVIGVRTPALPKRKT